jgi:hypothetical protein
MRGRLRSEWVAGIVGIRISTQVYVDLAGPDRHNEDRRDDEAIEEVL